MRGRPARRARSPQVVLLGVAMRKLLLKMTVGLLFCCPPLLNASAASVCPDNFEAYAGTTDPLACVCSAEATQAGQVYGMDVYTGDSGVCRAALHAGVVGASGGPVTVTPLPGRS